MSTQAEQALLGAMLLDNRQFHVAFVETRDFTDERHRKIYAAISELLKQGRPVDEVAIGEALGNEWRPYAAELAENVPRPESAPD